MTTSTQQGPVGHPGRAVAVARIPDAVPGVALDAAATLRELRRIDAARWGDVVLPARADAVGEFLSVRLHHKGLG